MGSKSPLVILVIGIIGFGAMGFMVKYSLESVPGLRKIAEVKQAMAEGFDGRDVRALSVRQEKKHSVVVKMTLGDNDSSDAPALAEEIAQFFITKYRGQRKRDITGVLEQPGVLGCGEEESFRQSYSVPELIAEKNLRVKLRRLDNLDVPASSIRIHRGVFVSMHEVRVEIVPIPGQTLDREHLQKHFRSLKISIEKSLRGSAVRQLVLVLRSEPGAEIQEEIRIDRTDNRLPAPAADSRSGTEPGPDAESGGAPGTDGPSDAGSLR